MPHWTHSPPADPRGQGLPLLRTPAARSLKAIVTSETLVGCDTHFWGGHTMPCERPDCEACNHGVAFRWHGYLSAYNPDDQLHFLFEMTAQAASTFAEYLQEHSTLRCCAFEAWRWRHARNGRLIIKCQHSAHPSHALPRAPDLKTVLAIIWRLPLPNVFTGGQLRGHPRIHADPNGDGSSADPREYSTPQP